MNAGFQVDFKDVVAKYKSYCRESRWSELYSVSDQDAFAFALHFFKERITEEDWDFLLSTCSRKMWRKILCVIPPLTAKKLKVRQRVEERFKGFRIVKELFERLEKRVIDEFKEDSPFKCELLYERSSSSEDGYYVFLAGGRKENLSHLPGIYVLHDSPGGRTGPDAFDKKAVLPDLEMWLDWEGSDTSFTQEAQRWLANQ
jgi:hypothetical protein